MASGSLTPTEHGKNPRQKLKLRPATFQDYSQIAALESRYGLPAKDYSEWTHMWQVNPLYEELKQDWAVGWVVEDPKRGIVGAIGNIPLAYEFEGKRVIAATGRSLVADPEYRSATLLLLDRVINQPGADLYLNNTMSSASAPSFAGFECARVPVGLWDQAAFWITNRLAFFENLLSRKSYRLAKPLSYPLSAMAFLKDQFTRQPWSGADVEVKPCPGFDSSFDGFWEQLKSRNPKVLLAVRTPQVLEVPFKCRTFTHS